jgi:hypothetical protein
MSSRRFLTLEEAASYLRMSPGELRQYVVDGKVAVANIGAGPIFDIHNLQRLMRDLSRPQSLPPGTIQKRIEEERRRRAELRADEDGSQK